MSDLPVQAVDMPPQPSALRLIATLGGIAVLSGLLVVSTYQLTKPRILENQRQALARAVYSVLPDAVSRQNYRLEDGALIADEAQPNVFAGFDAEGRLIGFAMEGSARGYQDVVRLLYGYDAEKQEVVGMTVLQSTETPGLGDKIIRDPQFHENFRALDVSRTVEVVKEGEKTEPWQIDGISGATVSSQAVGRAIETDAARRAQVRAAHMASPIQRAADREEATE